MIFTQLALGMVLPSAIAAQQPAPAPLRPANGTVTAAFTNVTSMHELSDGRVFMSDLTAGMIGTGNFTTAKFEPSQGATPGPLTPLAGDTTLNAGATRAGWVFFLKGRPIGMLAADNPVAMAARSIRGADSLGHVLASARSAVHQDSVRVVLVTRITAEQDTVVSIWQGPDVSYENRPVYAIYERALLTLDGWIAVTRIAPYRVDWRTPDGHWILGAPMPYTETKLDDREKRVVMQQRAMGGRPEAPETVTNWPATVAPWTSVRDLASPDGKLLVLRTRSADFPDTRYDVINRRGELEGQITMPANERIVGFGTKSVYVTVTAKDGIQSVQRHPWP
jgi:hypothetical protein